MSVVFCVAAGCVQTYPQMAALSGEFNANPAQALRGDFFRLNMFLPLEQISAAQGKSSLGARACREALEFLAKNRQVGGEVTFSWGLPDFIPGSVPDPTRPSSRLHVPPRPGISYPRMPSKFRLRGKDGQWCHEQGYTRLVVASEVCEDRLWLNGYDQRMKARQPIEDDDAFNEAVLNLVNDIKSTGTVWGLGHFSAGFLSMVRCRVEFAVAGGTNPNFGIGFDAARVGALKPGQLLAATNFYVGPPGEPRLIQYRRDRLSVVDCIIAADRIKPPGPSIDNITAAE